MVYIERYSPRGNITYRIIDNRNEHGRIIRYIVKENKAWSIAT